MQSNGKISFNVSGWLERNSILAKQKKTHAGVQWASCINSFYRTGPKKASNHPFLWNVDWNVKFARTWTHHWSNLSLENAKCIYLVTIVLSLWVVCCVCVRFFFSWMCSMNAVVAVFFNFTSRLEKLGNIDILIVYVILNCSIQL